MDEESALHEIAAQAQQKPYSQDIRKGEAMVFLDKRGEAPGTREQREHSPLQKLWSNVPELRRSLWPPRAKRDTFSFQQVRLEPRLQNAADQ
jgi:hypothetical protein